MHHTTSEPANQPIRRSRRRRYIVAGVLSIAALLFAAETIRRESRRRWLVSEVTAVGGTFKDYHADESWSWKLQYWYRFGEYPRLRKLHFTGRIDPEWLREHDYLRGLNVTKLVFHDCEVTGDDLAELIEAQPLDSLQLIDKDLSPRMLDAIASKRQWKNLQLSGCNLSDQDLQRLDLSRIEFLGVDSTDVTSDGLSILTHCECLDQGMFGGGQVNPQVARRLG
jgi:hypothetical protein